MGANIQNLETRHYYPYILKPINVLFMCLLIFCGALLGIYRTLEKESMPLLLNSGLTDVREAEIKITLWFEAGKPTSDLGLSLPQEGWEWKESNRKGLDSKGAYSISGYKIIHPQEEEQLYSWFQDLSDRVQAYGGIAYMDERIAEGIDVAKYSVQKGLIPLQWTLSENLISVTGLKKDAFRTVQAGSDSVNFQLLSQSNGTTGRAALAIPVLLEEF